MTKQGHATVEARDAEKLQLCSILNALSDPVRISIVEQLSSHGELSVGTLSEPYAITAPAISRHLRVLEAAGLIERRIDRQWRICSLNKDALSRVANWLEVNG
ncbi:ArsR/SmtB family transcription factor [Maritalea sp.]|jgi:DNA-binding transcriptional ArsR family regulator|uniref:ArsR/SmtB family transcription factor n=1 Tax=Maritalea sp. TaxID=2003361 RepID=UPI0039E6B54A